MTPLLAIILLVFSIGFLMAMGLEKLWLVIGFLMAGTLRAEINLAAQNGLYLVLLLLGGVIFPLDELPEPLQNVGKMLPSGALADVLRGAITDTAAYGQSSWVVLACWALLAPLAATKFFRWNSSQT